MQLISPAFQHNQMIPAKYTCQGEDINPVLLIKDIPSQSKSLVLMMDDPDAPGSTWDHWIIFNIAPTIQRIEEDTAPGTQGKNSWGRNDYGGPCPPAGTHRYFFKLYALNQNLNLKEGVRKREVEQTMNGHVIEKTELIGLYKKS